VLLLVNEHLVIGLIGIVANLLEGSDEPRKTEMFASEVRTVLGTQADA